MKRSRQQRAHGAAIDPSLRRRQQNSITALAGAAVVLVNE
jgi:hypothetical protein